MFLAGIPVNDNLVLTLAGQRRDAGLDNTAEELETAIRPRTKVLALEIPDREAILRCFEDCAVELAEFRATLLKEHERSSQVRRPVMKSHPEE